MGTRRDFLATVAATAASTLIPRVGSAASRRMPVLFVGHGSPMNAVEDNAWSRGFRSLAGLVPAPKAIVSISAHWTAPGLFLTGDARPRTIHDMSGFPREVQEFKYAAGGSPDLAARVRRMLGEERAALDHSWGIDHGTWSVLARMYPAADVPVIQLSLDERLAPAAHHELGLRLAELRDEGVLILGSGNVTHSLGDAMRRMRSGDTSTPDWARRFDAAVADGMSAHDVKGMLSLWPDTEDGRKSHPSGEHFLPLLYVLGAAQAGEAVTFPIEGFDAGSISMRSILIG
jgi:4,5-DOPA dioxygenase extradiol